MKQLPISAKAKFHCAKKQEDLFDSFSRLVNSGREQEAKRLVAPIIDGIAQKAALYNATFKISPPIDIAKAKEQAFLEALKVATESPEIANVRSGIKSIRKQWVIPATIASAVCAVATIVLAANVNFQTEASLINFAGAMIFGIATLMLFTASMAGRIKILDGKKALLLGSLPSLFIVDVMLKPFGLTYEKIDALRAAFGGKPSGAVPEQ